MRQDPRHGNRLAIDVMDEHQNDGLCVRAGHRIDGPTCLVPQPQDHFQGGKLFVDLRTRKNCILGRNPRGLRGLALRRRLLGNWTLGIAALGPKGQNCQTKQEYKSMLSIHCLSNS